MVDERPATAEGTSADAALVATICAACVERIPVSGASVSLTSAAGHRSTVHATDRVAAALEDLHFELGSGPAIDAQSRRQLVTVTDLADPHDRALAAWPGFGPAAVACGARALFAFPLQLGAAQLGVLLLYSDCPMNLTPGQHARALQLAEAAFFATLDLLSGSASSAGPAEQWQDGSGPFHRAEVYQAAGMVKAQLGIGIEEATIRLRAYAFARGRPVDDVARAVVERRLRLDDDGNDSEDLGMGERNE